MQITFQTSRLEKEFNSHKQLIKRYGPPNAELIERRMAQIRAAKVLEDLRALPQVHCHELTGDRAGQLAVYVKHPFRLIFVPADDPVPRRPDGGLDWTQVTAIMILGVKDYHD